MRVNCPWCGCTVKLNAYGEIPVHYEPSDDDGDNDDYELPCEGSGNEFENEDDEDE